MLTYYFSYCRGTDFVFASRQHCSVSVVVAVVKSQLDGSCRQYSQLAVRPVGLWRQRVAVQPVPALTAASPPCICGCPCLRRRCPSRDSAPSTTDASLSSSPSPASSLTFLARRERTATSTISPSAVLRAT